MKRKFFIFLVLVAAFLASRWLFKPGYFLMHDDLQMMRQLEMEKCWQDGQVPCRWVSDMGFGYGYPLFNFYPPLPYYVGQLFRWVGFNFMNTAKALFVLQFFLSGLTMFVLVADLWGNWAGLISAVFYIWAPYHSVDVYVRGAMNEAWAFIWFPLIFWAAKKLIEEEKIKHLLWLAFSYGMLLLSHNLMVMIFTPVMALWIFFWAWVKEKLPWQNFSVWLKFLGSGFWAVGLAAFFTLPIFFEQKFTHIETMFSGYFDWRAHFASINQLLISRFWGWGPSLWLQDDGMPFPVGQIHWILGVVILGWLGFKVFIKKDKQLKKRTNLLLLLGLFGLAFFYTFLAHQRSVFLWKLIPVLQMAQFPWRLLAGSAFFFSLLAGTVVLVIKKKWLWGLLVLLVIAWNWSFFRPEKMGPLTDAQKFSGRAWEYQQTAGIYDYLPKTVPQAPVNAPESEWTFFGGEAKEVKTVLKSNYYQWEGEVDQGGTLRTSIFYFPGWRVWVDEEEKELNYDEDLGRMEVELEPGRHLVYFRFTNTPIRSWANLISLISWLGLIVVWTNKKWSWLPKI